MTHTAEQFKRIAEMLGNDFPAGKQYRFALKSESWLTISAALAIASRVSEPGVIEDAILGNRDISLEAGRIRTALLQDKTDG